MEAQPLKIWLTTGSYDLPIIGSSLMQQEWFHYFMSWGGMFYDLLIPFILLYHRTRIFGFLLHIFSHIYRNPISYWYVPLHHDNFIINFLYIENS